MRELHHFEGNQRWWAATHVLGINTGPLKQVVIPEITLAAAACMLALLLVQPHDGLQRAQLLLGARHRGAYVLLRLASRHLLANVCCSRLDLLHCTERTLELLRTS